MANVNDNEIRLGLALGVSNQCVESLRTHISTGAGANANIRLRSPLAELVWSTQNGISIKCAGCSRCFADKKACVLTDTEMGVSSCRVEKRASDGHSGGSRASCHVGSSDIGHTGRTRANDPEIVQVGDGTVGLGLDIEENLKQEGSCSAPCLEKDEETAENDAQDLISKECFRQGDGSMESCNSASLLSDSNKRWRFEQELFLGSKRIKKQTVKHDSSFMNWISNMVKGIKPIQEEGNPTGVCSTFGSKRLGFQTVFQSLYSPDAKPLKTIVGGADNMNQNTSDSLWITRKAPSFDDASASMKSCFFCGKMGHGLRNCSEIDEKQRVGILKNITLYEGVAKEAPCFCIKCFQLNHWASVCPSKSMIEMMNLNLNPKENQKVFPGEKASNLNEIASRSNKDKASNEEMFETIRRLRLSRTDILKWTNSCLPIANLDGFFLRLRLAKWDEGVGEAGYYVACITGSQGENGSKGSKKRILVNVGGVECLVESRYVSNCDFLEEELVAWWQKAWMNGGIPMKEKLSSKLEERKKLGF